MRIIPILFAAFAGMLGGALSVRLFSTQVVQAQDVRNSGQTVQARTFVLLDSVGRKRGEWKVDGTGEPALTFFDENGNVRATISPNPQMRPLVGR